MAVRDSKKNWDGQAIDVQSLDALDFTLSYAGKKEAIEILNTPRIKAQTIWETAPNTQNRLYYGNNLHLLANLLDDDSICGKVRLIYIDPPFATNGIFKSRSQNSAYTDLLRGAEFIEFLRQRIIIMRELLADDGSLYLHLDANMVFPIKIILDEIFGKKQFRSFITRRKCNPKNYTRNTYGNISDYILFYTKSDTFIWNRPMQNWTEETLTKEYQYIEKETGRRYKKVPVHAPGKRNGATGQAWRGKLPPDGKHWQYTPATLDEMDARGEIYWSPTGNPRRKIYADQSVGIPIQDIWLDMKDAHNQNIKITGYPTEKPPQLLKRIIEASSNLGDIVLDCFSGSGTTLSEADALNRHWIGMDNSVEAIKTTMIRLKQGLSPMGDYVQAKPTQQQLVLFNTIPNMPQFSLWATSPYQGELDTFIQDWSLPFIEPQ
ncbi:MAG: site-specific DNA-methyltransferase [Anaerolineae bacterium]|nr:site-specific DNA-methyltransferase [Anaerolineae bacterium]